MARLMKAKADFAQSKGPYSYSRFKWLIEQLGYDEIKKKGKTGGSRRKFKDNAGHLIMLDEPHDGEMGRDMVKRLQKLLRERKLI